MEGSVSTQWADRITTINREHEVLAQFCATQEKFSKLRMERKHTRIKTINREDEVLAQPIVTQERFSKQRMDRKHITTQQENYNTALYKTNCLEESVSSQWVDRIKTSSREDEVLAKASATQETFSKQRKDRTYITNQQEK